MSADATTEVPAEAPADADRAWLEQVVKGSRAMRRARQFFGKQERLTAGLLNAEPGQPGAPPGAIASWRAPSSREAVPQHVIWVRENAAAWELVRTKRARIIEAALRHETWHARETDRDHNLMHYAAKMYNVPHQLYNLFEDARIEDIARWTEYDVFGYFAGDQPLYQHHHVGDVEDPLDLFQYLTMCDADPEHEAVAMRKFTGTAHVKHRGRYYLTTDLVRWFVQRAQRATSTRALWPIMLEFLEAFPQYATDVSREVVEAAIRQPKAGGLDKMAPDRGDVTTGMDASAPGSQAGDGDNESDDGDGDPGGFGYSGLWDPNQNARSVAHDILKVRELVGNYKHGPTTTTTKLDAGIKPFLIASHFGTNDSTHAPDLSAAPEIARTIRRMAGFTDASRTRTSTSGSHLHMPTTMTGAADAFRRTITRKGRRRVCLVMDMSGSMCGPFMWHGAAFIEALLILEREGVFEVDIWLSGGGRRYRLPKRTPTDVVESLAAAHGSEGIMATLEDAKADVMAADTVLVYTDGALTDGDIDTAKWRSRGVDLIGVMTIGGDAATQSSLGRDDTDASVAIGTALQNSRVRGKHMQDALEQYQERMNRHFHKALVAPSPRELAVRVTQYILAKQA